MPQTDTGKSNCCQYGDSIGAYCVPSCMRTMRVIEVNATRTTRLIQPLSRVAPSPCRPFYSPSLFSLLFPLSFLPSFFERSQRGKMRARQKNISDEILRRARRKSVESGNYEWMEGRKEGRVEPLSGGINRLSSRSSARNPRVAETRIEREHRAKGHRPPWKPWRKGERKKEGRADTREGWLEKSDRGWAVGVDGA